MKKISALFFTAIAAFALCGAESIFAGENSSAKKILVVYYSRTGNTKVVAEEIASMLNADVEQIVDMKDRSGKLGAIGAGKDATFKNETEILTTKKNPADYDLVVLSTPVWSWNVTPALRTYINKYKKSFKNIACMATSQSTKMEKITPIIEELAGKNSVASQGFVEDDFKTKNAAIYDAKLKAFTDAIKEELSK